MYTRSFTRSTPGCVVFLVDRSDGMGAACGQQSGTFAAGVARAVNRALQKLVVRSGTGSGRVRHLFDVGVLGYGIRSSDDAEGVEPALGGVLTGRGLVPIDELAENPARTQTVPSADAAGPPVEMPVWVEPRHGGRTPLCEAIAVAGAHIHEWILANPASFPPIVVNITTGVATDSPYEGATLAEWAARLSTLRTDDGALLLFTVFLTSGAGAPVLFPARPDGLPHPGPALFDLSSPLPETMVRTARLSGMSVPDGARALIAGADADVLDRAFGT